MEIDFADLLLNNFCLKQYDTSHTYDEANDTAGSYEAHFCWGSSYLEGELRARICSSTRGFVSRCSQRRLWDYSQACGGTAKF